MTSRSELSDREIVLIYPRLTEHPAGKPFLPLSVLALVGPLEEQGFEVRVLDENVEPIHQQLEKLDSRPACFGISCMIGHQLKSGLQIAKKIREVAPGRPIVWGGWFPTLVPDITIADPLVDIVVRGKAETAVVELAEHIYNNRPPADVKGILYKENQHAVATPDRPLDNPNNFPALRLHHLDLSRYIVSDGWINYFTSYGCPFRCGFCGISKGLKTKWNGGLNPARLLDELEHLTQQYGIKHVQFTDDNFCCNQKRANEIWKGMIERDLHISWIANTRVDQFVRFAPETLENLSKAVYLSPSNRSQFVMGVESMNQSMLDFITKDISVAQVDKAIELGRQYDLPIVINIISGLPADTPEGYMETLRKARSYLENYPRLHIAFYQYVPIAGTALFEFEKKEGRVYEPGSLREWAYVTEDIDNVYDYNKRLHKYTSETFRVMTFHFRHAYLIPHKRPGRGIFNIPQQIFSRTSALRFRHAFWRTPIEWRASELVKRTIRGVISLRSGRKDHA